MKRSIAQINEIVKRSNHSKWFIVSSNYERGRKNKKLQKAFYRFMGLERISMNHSKRFTASSNYEKRFYRFM